MSFITAYLKYTSELESPGSFFKWSSYACIAGALRDHVYLKIGPRYIYPNIYVLLLADSAVARKSVPLSICADLLKKIEATKIIRGRTSIQAIISDLASVSMDKESGKILKGGSCLLCAEELASFFVSDPFAMTILTDIYDFRLLWENNLKATGKEKIQNLCVSMIAASNETHLKEIWGSGSVFGGLMGRTFFVKPNERRPGNSLLEDINTPVNGHYDDSKLLKILAEIVRMNGIFQVEPDAKRAYDSWYLKLYKKYESRPDKTGVMARIHTGVLKVAMILAVGHDMELVLRKKHIEESIDDCITLIPNYEVFTMSAGKATDAQVATLLLTELLDEKHKNRLSRRIFLRLHWTEVDEKILDMLVEKLVHSGILIEDIEGDTGTIHYSLTELGKRKLQKQKESQEEET